VGKGEKLDKLLWMEPPTLIDVFKILAGVVGGFALYLLRCRKQLLYGIVELVFSVIILTLTFIPQLSYLTADSSFLGSYLVRGIGLLTGLYTLVRGMDNIDKSLTAKWRKRWDLVFHGSSKGKISNR
jgi:hypothetical protein